MKTQIRLFLLIIGFIVILQSCVDGIAMQVKEVNAMLVFESDINTVNGFSAKLSTSTGLTNVSATSFPDDLEVLVRYNDTEVFEMYYNSNCVCYENSMMPLEGVRYEVFAKAPNNIIYEDINGEMIFPLQTKSLDLEASRYMDTDGKTILESMVLLDGKTNSSNYFHILPFRKKTEIVIENGVQKEVYTGEIEYLELMDFNNDNLYIESLYNKPGFLVDFNEENIKSNALNLVLKAPTLIEYDTQSFDQLFYEVRSVTESYYRYKIYQSRKLESLESGIVEQPTMFGNIVNGRGYFGGYNTVLDSVTIHE